MPRATALKLAVCGAGQAVVQVAEDSKSRIEYAMKFYLSRQAFLDEKALYEDPSQPLGQFLPEVCTTCSQYAALQWL